MTPKGLILAALAIAAASPVAAVELVLRDRAVAPGPVVTLADVVNAKATWKAGFNAHETLAQTHLMPAPAPGTETHLSAARLRDLLSARGLNIGQIRLTGAQVVSISAATASPKFVTPATMPADTQQHRASRIPTTVDEAIVAAIQTHLIEQTGHPDWQVELELRDKTRTEISRLPAAPKISGGRAPWTGRQRFALAASLPLWQTAATKSIVLVARVAKLQHAVVITRPIERGQLIRPTDVELQLVDRTLPTQAARALQDAVGMESQQPLREGSLVMLNQLRSPLLVRRGELVTVYARTGGIVARTTAVARQGGSRGDLVQVEITDSKKRINAQVTAFRQLDVLAEAAQVEDFSTAQTKLPALQ